MCRNHHALFKAYDFFIRFFPDVSLTSSSGQCIDGIHEQSRKFVLVNYAGCPDLEQFHGKAIALDIKDPHVPLPSLFIIYEMRVRGFHPFEPISPAMPDNILSQDWISSDGVFNEASDTSVRRSPLEEGKDLSRTTSTGDSEPVSGPRAGEHLLPLLTADVIADILDATRAMPSWRACVMEGTRQSGTAENIEDYISSIQVGPQDDQPRHR